MSTIAAGTTTTTALVSTGDTTGNLVFQTNGTTTAVTIDTSQNVGIGTTSPSTFGRLAVLGQATKTIGVRVASDGTAGSPAETSLIGSFFATGAHEAGVYSVNTFSSDFGNGLTFKTTNTAGTTAERMRIDSSGNVGIGTTSPDALLQVNKSDASTTIGGSAAKIVVQNNSGSTLNQTSGIEFNVGNLPLSQSRLAGVYGLYEAYNPTALAGALVFATNSAGSTTISERARITSGGEVYIAGTTDQGAYNLQVNGTGVWGAGAYVNGSDARLKENVQTLTDGLSVVTQLRPVTFQYKADYSKDTSVQPGFIAQELQAALQGKDYVDGVVQAGPEYLNVAYQSLIPVLVKAIQEQQTIIEDLRARIAVLEAK